MKLLHVFIWLLFFSFISIFITIMIPQTRFQNDLSSFKKYHWISSHIHSNSDEVISIAFVGSSHIWNAVDPRIIKKNIPFEGNALNFGVNWFGRDIQYLIIKELLENKKVSHIFLEFWKKPDHRSHAWFYYVSSFKDILSPANIQYIKEYFLQLLIHSVKGVHGLFLYVFSDHNSKYQWEKNLGFYGNENSNKKAQAKLEKDFSKVKYTNHSKEEKFLQQFSANDTPRIIIEEFDHHYLNLIGLLCQQHHVKLSFLYLEGFNAKDPEPDYTAYLRQFGDVIIPPADTFFQPKYWRNKGHVNKYGAQFLSQWLAESIQQHYPELLSKR